MPGMRWQSDDEISSAAEHVHEAGSGTSDQQRTGEPTSKTEGTLHFWGGRPGMARPFLRMPGNPRPMKSAKLSALSTCDYAHNRPRRQVVPTTPPGKGGGSL